METVDTLPTGTRIGAYRIDRILGEGGMGFVYEATHEVLNRRSAIKMLRPELATHAHIVTRFLNEAKAVNLIDHQNIVNVYDYGDNLDGSVYFVMELLEGQTLDDLMRKRRPMAMPLLLHVFSQIGKALAAAHAKRIVHRDLKPANVYVVVREDNPCFVKLLDFGIAQLRGHGAVHGFTQAGTVLGTPQYMSPEQISGGTVDERTDVWALGVMLYRAATGHAAFHGEEFVQLADRILHHAPQPAGELVPLPAALSALIASCLERRIEQRCPSVGAVLAGLERVKHECKLDDEAIAAAVAADSGAVREGVPARPGDPTRDSIGGSLPRYQDAGPHQLRPSAGPPPPRSRLGLFVTIGVILGGLGSAAFVMLGPNRTARRQHDAGRGSGPGMDVGSDATPRVTGARPGPTPGPTIEQLVTAGDLAGWHARVANDLRDAITSEALPQGLAVDALALAHARAAQPLLHLALKGPPEVRAKAARALGELGLPDSAPRLRAALAESGDKIKVEIAAPLYRLGDKDARAILVRALSDMGVRLTAAAAMAEAGDDAGRAVLADILEATPAGRESWRRAAGALVSLGDANARILLNRELAQPDGLRAVAAAEILARAGDTEARELLSRVAADRELVRRGDAALALARLGDRRALGWVAEGLASTDVDERIRALAVCGRLAADAAVHTRAIAQHATTDPDPGVRMTAEAVLLGL